ncbi:hypothetical protein C3489_02420 [Streptomyces sp. Ru71]|uniref:hypothetical protein n=1 Tax=Streptomyces sp. Ru71 TaxID=2080746 RepID=UPI000CDE3FD7|nr:hypothetical protein [Streptomyces sp. Ru71]POX57121.1 hypothetical protein C3489_02420 [Streptomyces sp. Ru71]
MRRTALAATALCLVTATAAALTGCQSGQDKADDKPAASAAPAKAKDPNAGLPTGTQLKQLLTPASVFPAGLTPVADGAADSGGDYLAPSSRSTAKTDCTKLENTAWLDVTGYKGGVSFAQDDYANQDQTEEIAEEVDAFQGTTARTVLQRVREVAAECATFTDTADHVKVRVKGKAADGLGDEAYVITLTSGSWENGSTLIATRVGSTVATVMSTAGSDNGAAAAKKVATHLAASLKKAGQAS